MPGRGTGLLLQPVGVSGGLQLGLHAGREPVAGADRGDQRAVRQLGQRGVGVGVVHEGGQMRLVRHLTAEGDREAQGGAGPLAEPGGEQRGGRGPFGERGQRYVMADAGVEGRVDRHVDRGVLEDAELVEGVLVGLHLVAMSQQRPGLHEAQRQALGLEPEVARPVGLLLGQHAADGPFQELQTAAAVESAEEHLFEEGVGGRRGDVGGRGDEEGALGCGVEEFVERAASDLHVVEDDDRADAVDEFEQLVPFRPVQGRVVDGGEQVVEQVARGPPVSGQADDAVGGEVGAVLGDGFEQAGAA